MPDISKLPRKLVYGGVAAAVALTAFALQDLRLRSNLKSTTRITQNLRQELDGLRKENETYKMSELSDKTSIDKLSEQLNTLAQDRSLTVSSQTELKKKVTDAESTLQAQNSKIAQLEGKLKEAETKISRQKKASANLEQQTKSAKANPGMTSEYVKLVENEWLTAVAKTEELNKDLNRTLSELSGQNQERSKLRSDTATMHYNLAVILTEQQNFPAAIVEYQKVLEIRPNDADAHYNLGVIYDDYLQDNERALEHYRQYVKTAPDAPEAQKVRQWIKDKEYDNTFKFKI